MKRSFSSIRAAVMAAALTAAGAVSAAADGLSPATGERTRVLPFVLGAVGLVAVAALIVRTVMDAKKKTTPPPPTDTPPTPPTPPAGPNDDADGL